MVDNINSLCGSKGTGLGGIRHFFFAPAAFSLSILLLLYTRQRAQFLQVIYEELSPSGYELLRGYGYNFDGGETIPPQSRFYHTGWRRFSTSSLGNAIREAIEGEILPREGTSGRPYRNFALLYRVNISAK